MDDILAVCKCSCSLCQEPHSQHKAEGLRKAILHPSRPPLCGDRALHSINQASSLITYGSNYCVSAFKANVAALRSRCNSLQYRLNIVYRRELESGKYKRICTSEILPGVFVPGIINAISLLWSLVRLSRQTFKWKITHKASDVGIAWTPRSSVSNSYPVNSVASDPPTSLSSSSRRV